MLSHAAEDARLAPPPEITLATAVLNRAVEDLSWGFTTAARAAIWLTSDSTEPYSALSLCDALGIHHGSIVAHVHRTWPRYQKLHWTEYSEARDVRAERPYAITDAEIRAWAAAGLSVSQIAREYGVPHGQIRAAAARRNITLANGPTRASARPHITRDQLQSWHDAGLTYGDVCRTTPWSKTQLVAAEQTHGIRLKRTYESSRTPINLDEFRRRILTGAPVPSAAHACGLVDSRALRNLAAKIRRGDDTKQAVRAARPVNLTTWEALKPEAARRILAGEQPTAVAKALGIPRGGSLYRFAAGLRGRR